MTPSNTFNQLSGLMHPSARRPATKPKPQITEVSVANAMSRGFISRYKALSLPSAPKAKRFQQHEQL